MSYEDLAKANESITPIELVNEKTGKKIGDYAEVNQRIKAFRMVYPEGTILTNMVSNDNGVCVFRASIYANNEKLLATGTAYEKEGSTYINRTSYIENCETSAVGRALAMCGFGIDKSIASAEEVQNAVENQEITIDDALAYVFDKGKNKGKSITELYKEDKGYLQWWLDKSNNDMIKQMIMMATDMKPTPIPTEEEQKVRFELMTKLQKLMVETKTDYETLYTHYDVKSDAEMTNEQLKDAIGKLEG